MSQCPRDKKPAPTAEAHRFRFQLSHVLYAMTVLGASIATLGLVGMFPAYLIIRLWGAVFHVFRRSPLFLAFLAGMLCVLLPILLLFRPGAASQAERTSCQRNAMVLASALLNYHDTHGSFPPAYVPDANGKPKHSWRVLILPFLKREDLYEAYDFDEPWDGPNNRKLLEDMPTNFACPSCTQPDGHTSYLAVVGPRTAWPGEKTTRHADFTDGTSNTILFIEANGRGVPWTQPRDVSLDEAVDLATSDDLDGLGGHRDDEFFYEKHSGRLVGFADAFAAFLPHGMPEERLVALLTINDGKRVSYDRVDFPVRTLRRPSIANWYRLTLFVGLMLLPLPWALMPLLRRGKK